MAALVAKKTMSRHKFWFPFSMLLTIAD